MPTTGTDRDEEMARMTTPAASSSRARVRWRWRHVSQIRRADLYLRTSLYVLLWGIPLFVLATFLPRIEATEVGVVMVVLLVACVTGTTVLREVIALHPARGPLPWRSLAGLGLALVVTVVVARLLGAELGGPLTLLVAIAAAMATGGLTDPRAVAASVLVYFLLPLAGAGSVTGAVIVAAYTLFLVFTVRSSLWLYGVIDELDRNRRAQSALAVAEERLRFSRDVHDVMGRRLSTIAVQAELASTLARRGDERAVQQMLEVREGAHEALREVRELARGYRETDLDAELEGARSLLGSAGISCTVDVAGVPAQWTEPSAWVVREAVTNVLRHSVARHVHIGWDGAGLRITDDGEPQGTPGDGSGLRGLRERVEPLGARLEAGPTEAGYVVTMRVETT